MSAASRVNGLVTRLSIPMRRVPVAHAVITATQSKWNCRSATANRSNPTSSQRWATVTMSRIGSFQPTAGRLLNVNLKSPPAPLTKRYAVSR